MQRYIRTAGAVTIRTPWQSERPARPHRTEVGRIVPAVPAGRVLTVQSTGPKSVRVYTPAEYATATATGYKTDNPAHVGRTFGRSDVETLLANAAVAADDAAALLAWFDDPAGSAADIAEHDRDAMLRAVVALRSALATGVAFGSDDTAEDETAEDIFSS